MGTISSTGKHVTQMKMSPRAPAPEVPDDFDATEGAVASGESAPGVLSQHPLGSQENPIPLSQGNYWPLKHALMKHLSYAYTQGKLSWPKHFSKVQKLDMPLLTRASKTFQNCSFLFEAKTSNYRPIHRGYRQWFVRSEEVQTR
jgi:hypothetical protein